MKAKHGTIFEAKITDGKGILTLTFFNQAWRKNDLKPGVRGIFAGKVGDYKGLRQLAHPDYELFDETVDLDNPVATDWVNKPIPIYPATATVASWQIAEVGRAGARLACRRSTIRCRRMCAPITGSSATGARSSSSIVRRSDADWRGARTALRFQEAFVLQAALLQQRAELRSKATTPRLPGRFAKEFDARDAVHADDGPEAGRRRDRHGPRRAGAHEPARAGRGGLGQDSRRAAGDALGR